MPPPRELFNKFFEKHRAPIGAAMLTGRFMAAIDEDGRIRELVSDLVQIDRLAAQMGLEASALVAELAAVGVPIIADRVAISAVRDAFQGRRKGSEGPIGVLTRALTRGGINVSRVAKGRRTEVTLIAEGAPRWFGTPSLWEKGEPNSRYAPVGVSGEEVRAGVYHAGAGAGGNGTTVFSVGGFKSGRAPAIYFFVETGTHDVFSVNASELRDFERWARSNPGDKPSGAADGGMGIWLPAEEKASASGSMRIWFRQSKPEQTYDFRLENRMCDEHGQPVL